MLPEKVVEEMRNAIKDLGYDLVHLEWKGGRSRGVLRLFIESESGITVDDCQNVSKEVSVLLDVMDPISHAYSLEVSSPGVQRPIYNDDEYGKFLSKGLYVKVKEPSEPAKVLKGELLSCDNESITLKLKKGEKIIKKHYVHEARLLGPWEEVD